MAIAERHSGETILQGAERVLHDVAELKKQRRLTRGYAVTAGRTAGRIERDLSELLERTAKNGSWNTIRCEQLVRSIKDLSSRYWKQREQHI